MTRDTPNEGQPRDKDVHALSPARRIENLLDQLQAQTRLVRDTWEAGEAARLRILAAELTSLAEGSGHTAISASAGELEAMLIAEEAEASAICERIEALIKRCKQAASADR